jgi:glycine/D-amino acid oxidase-like deaminating enzyme
MKLRTGKPLWLASKGAPLPVVRLSRTVTCDVVIIGAGITGALVAHQLLNAGLKIVMIEKRRVGLGSTAASTGLLMVQPDLSIADLTRLHDQRTARRVYQLGQQAIGELARLTRRLKLECGWEAKRTFYLASNQRGATLIRSEAKRARQINHPVQHLSAEHLRARYGLPFDGALLSAGSAQVHALDLTRGLLRHLKRHPNFSLYQHTRVTSLRESAGSIRLPTHTGGEVWARHAIVATGYESRRFVRSKLVRLRSTYVIASKPFPPARLDSVRYLMWETARPYFYLRTTSDHRIVFGGADEPFVTDSDRERKLKRKTRELEHAFAANFPQLAFKADYAWSGAFAETTDGLPCVGPKSVGSRIFFALGYGGNGITFSQIAARILRDACIGKKNPDAKLFGFQRLAHRRT